MSKVVVISPYRTATQSTNQLLKSFGYKTIHYGGTVINGFELIGYPSEYVLEKMAVFADMYEAFSDNPYPVMYKHFDETYPGSKFIMIKRDPDSWYKSIQSLNEFLHKDEIDPFERTFFTAYLKNVPKTFKEIPYNDYIKCYNSHIRAVEEYFKDKDNLLVLDISDDKKGVKIANFLDKDFFPKVDFTKSPFTNRASSTF